MHVNKFESLVIYFAMKLPISDWTLHNSPVIKSDTKNFLYQLKKKKNGEKPWQTSFIKQEKISIPGCTPLLFTIFH